MHLYQSVLCTCVRLTHFDHSTAGGLALAVMRPWAGHKKRTKSQNASTSGQMPLYNARQTRIGGSLERKHHLISDARPD